ncbi:MAG: PEGA domain-containing protein [Spirochaetia bacterium]|nr:PEGA domain-containing protein [Spirochaetia bacterium]
MRHTILVLVIMVAFLGSAFANDPLPEVEVEATALGGSSALSVQSDVRGAEVWVDYIRRGTVPLDITGLSPGSHLLILRMDGYYDNSIQLTLAPDTTTTVTASMLLKTGFVQLQTEPRDAMVIFDGDEYESGMIELPIGNVFLTVKSFGYREKTIQVFVLENQIVQAEAVLELAPFEATGFTTSRTRFNPRNAGTRGLVRTSFTASAPGRAQTSIFAPDGSLVDVLKSGIFSEWEQSVQWNGKGQDLNPVADGRYLLSILVTPEEGLPAIQDEYLFESYVTIDSSIVVTPRGSYGAIPGSLWAPEAFPPAESSAGMAISGFVHSSFDTDPTGGVMIGFSLSVEGLLDAGLAVEAGVEDDSGAGLLGFRLSAPLTGPVGLALTADGRLAAATADSPAWARGGFGFGLGTRFVNLVLAPDLGAYWQDGFSARAGLGSALNLAGYSASASLSARIESTGFDEDFALARLVQTGLELRFLPPELPIGIRLFGGLAWDPQPASWQAGLGISGSL